MQIKRHNLVIILLTFFLTFFFSTCSKVDKKIIPEAKFTEVLGDIMIISNLGIPQTERAALLKTVFEKHEISVEQFRFTRDHYKKDAAFWIRVYNRAQEQIRDKKSL